MVSLTNDEEDIIETLVECLAHAIEGHEDVSPASLNKTLVQKFVYLGVNEFGLSLSYSWYLAGSLVESDTASPSALTTAFDDVARPDEPSIDAAVRDTEDPDAEATTSLSDEDDETTDAPADIQYEFAIEREADPHIESSDADTLEDIDAETFEVEDDTTAGDLPTHPDVPVQECIEYYEQELDRYPLHPTDRFLQQFYKYHAPDPYNSLYVNCLHVRSTLRTLEQTVQAHVNDESPAVELQQVEADINRHISRVHLELADIQSIDHTLDAVVEGTDIIEDAVMKLRQLAPSDLRPEHVDAVETLQDFYFQWVWKYPALKISSETATGPSADRIRRSRKRTFDSFDSELRERFESIRRELDAVDLVPTYEEYPALDRMSTNEAIVDFTNAYVDE